MNFNFGDIGNTSFGVCTREKGDIKFFDVPVDARVKQLVQEMAVSTWDQMRSKSTTAIAYEPSERYPGRDHLFVDLTDPSVEVFRDLQWAVSCNPGSNVLRDPRTVFCYFGRLVDGGGHRLIGMRRSSTFKGVLKQKPRLVSLISDELRAIDDDLFRLDWDFDVLVDDEQVHILRAAGFESLGELRDAIKAAAAVNLMALRRALPFVDMGELDPDSPPNITRARQLASVKDQRLEEITADSLRRQCQQNAIEFSEENGILRFADQGLSDVLDLLDRRLYVDELVTQERTKYKAGSRRVRG